MACLTLLILKIWFTCEERTNIIASIRQTTFIFALLFMIDNYIMVHQFNLHIFFRDLRLFDNFVLSSNKLLPTISIFILDPIQCKINNKNKFYF